MISQYGATVTSVMNAVQIQVLNFVYRKIALKLTEFENHRTQTQFEDSLIVKVIVNVLYLSYITVSACIHAVVYTVHCVTA
jgi:Calcium-activated chloride channel